MRLSRIKYLLATFIFFFFLFSKIKAVFAQEKFTIESVDVQAQFDKEGLLITEKVKVNFAEKVDSFSWPIARRIEIGDYKLDVNPRLEKVEVRGAYDLKYSEKGDLKYVYAEVNSPDILRSKREIDITYRSDILYADKDQKYIVYLLGSDKLPDIKKASFQLNSPNEEIGDIQCFGGDLTSFQRLCRSEFDKNTATVTSATELSNGKSLGVVVSLLTKAQPSEVKNQKANKFIRKLPLIFLIIILLIAVWYIVKRTFLKGKKITFKLKFRK